ncbi:MAG: hypothetical protein A2452_05855 [Candidatus Firestonebacteria bacterium RIFOXYC2_FULL_39_67]|nr:MAG: hypothetical protein A2536_11930 [Candidatus Firestonebacteria bacterium RIFOXYD2_FULL_39_29]OGF56598.1 MAG: hypothetical protein A2452_05855 [Candidatus Firestonebacteria bacterium RIFOXYC2_FULL_39_67]
MMKTKIRILLVEDNETEAELIIGLLRSKKAKVFDIKTVTNLTEALKACQKEVFDSIILDLNLPESKGVNTLERFYSVVKDTPVIALADSADRIIGFSIKKEEIQDYIIKDQLNKDKLVEALLVAAIKSKNMGELRKAFVRKGMR